MKTKNLIYLSPIVSLFVVAILGSTIFLTTSFVTSENQTHDDAFAISDAMLNLREITFFYLVYHENQSIDQWTLEYDSIQELIKGSGEEFTFLNPTYDTIDEKFVLVVENHLEEQKLISENADNEMINVLITQQVEIEAILIQDLQELSDMSVKTTLKSYENANQSQENANLIIIFAVVGLVLAITILSLSVGRFLNSVILGNEKTNRVLNQYKDALDNADLVVITDIDGKITYVNDKFCEVSKYSKKELFGKTFALLRSGYHPEGFFTNLMKTISSGQVWRGDIKDRAKDGSNFWVKATITPFF